MCGGHASPVRVIVHHARWFGRTTVRDRDARPTFCPRSFGLSHGPRPACLVLPLVGMAPLRLLLTPARLLVLLLLGTSSACLLFDGQQDCSQGGCHEVSSGGGTLTCAGGGCTQLTSGGGTLTCTGGNCQQTTSGGGMVTCAGGQCEQTTSGDATCTCGGGGCEQSCSITDCSGGGCVAGGACIPGNKCLRGEACVPTADAATGTCSPLEP
jgi:hypothetical protein